MGWPPLLTLAATTLLVATAPAGGPPDIGLFAEAASLEEAPAREALKRLAATWKDDYAALIVDLARLMRAPGREPVTNDLEGRAAPAR